MKTSNTLKELVNALPDKPGVYQYFNVNNEIIYVGKAKNLKKGSIHISIKSMN
jgi:excinuclease ABC subunit C